MERENIGRISKKWYILPIILVAVVIIIYIVSILIFSPYSVYSARNVFDEMYSGAYYESEDFSLNRIEWLEYTSSGGGWFAAPGPEYWTANEEKLPSDEYEIYIDEFGRGQIRIDADENRLLCLIDFAWSESEASTEIYRVYCVFNYSPKDKTLSQSVSSSKNMLTEEQMKEYQHYALYDMLIKSWCETNPSAFSVDDIGDITIIDGKRPK